MLLDILRPADEPAAGDAAPAEASSAEASAAVRPVVDPDLFRSVLGRFASGVTVVTGRDPAGRDHGMTVSAFCSLSLDPPLVVVCIDRGATMHDHLVEDAPFVVNVLASGQEALSRRFASADPPERFDGVGYQRGALGVAVLDDTNAHLECRVQARYPGGDHTIVVGRVEGAATADARPLLYYRSGYASLER